MRFNPFHIAVRAPTTNQWFVRATCALAIVSVAMLWGAEFLFAVAGIFAGEALRCLQELAVSFLRGVRRLRDNAARRAKTIQAIAREITRLAAAQIARLSRQAVAIQIVALHQVRATRLAAKLRAGNGNIAHVALSARLLPAPVSAR